MAKKSTSVPETALPEKPVTGTDINAHVSGGQIAVAEEVFPGPSHYSIPAADFEALVTALKLKRVDQFQGAALMSKLMKWFDIKTYYEAEALAKVLSDNHFKRMNG